MLQCWDYGSDSAVGVEIHFVNARFAMVPVTTWDRPTVIDDVVVAIGESQYRIVARGLNPKARVRLQNGSAPRVRS